MKTTINNNTEREYRVFIVEDSDPYRSRIVEYLTRIKNSQTLAGSLFTVTGFSSGEEALENLHEKPEIVILDYFLDSGGFIDNSNGLTILKKIKHISPKTEVAMLSCQPDETIITDFIQAGASKYISKKSIAPLLVYEFISETIGALEKNNKK